MARNVLDRKTTFSPKRVFRMDDKKAFNEDFDISSYIRDS